MQRNLLRTVAAIALATLTVSTALTSCSQAKRWTDEERRATREMIRDWQKIVYLNELSEEEFALFRSQVVDHLERQYPVYAEFIEMPMVGDSVEMVILATIVTEIKASPTKMRHIFPYAYLVGQGYLPSGMDRHKQDEFYRCFADCVNRNYGSIQQFVWDAFNYELDDILIENMMERCAAPYWDKK